MANIVIFLVYKILLDLIYLYDIAPYYWGYNGLVCKLDLFLYGFTWIVYIIFVTVWGNYFKQKWSEYKFSDYFFLLFFLFYFVPGLVMYGLGGFDSFYFVLFLIFCVLMYKIRFFMEKFDVPIIEYGVNSRLANKKNVVFFLLSLVSIVSVLFTFIYYDFSIFIKDFSNLYEQRRLFSNIKMPKLLSYIIANACIINIIFSIYCIKYKRYFIAMGMFVLQFLLFSLDASKLVLFINILIILFILLNDRIKLHCFMFLLISIFIFTIIYSIFFPMSIPAGYIRRFMFIPNLLSYNYYDFFSNHTPLYYFINKDNYPNLSNLIAAVYHNKPQMSANNGFMGDAIANLGVCGVVIYPIIYNIYIKIIDICSIDIESKYVSGVSLLIFVTLQNSFFSTSILSHGLLLLVIMLYCLPRKL